MKTILTVLFFLNILISCTTSKNNVLTNNDEELFKKLRTEMGLAFINGDIETIIAYHHPDVLKSHAYNKLLVGRDENINDLKGTLKAFSVKFKEHQIESFTIHGNTATEISNFTLEGIPRGDGKPFLFKGRSMVIYIRYKESPAGWAILREMIQTP